MLLAGLVAGLSTTAVALVDGRAAASAREPRTLMAAAVTRPATPVVATNLGFGSQRLAERDDADRLDRRAISDAVSRSSTRPALDWPAPGALTGWFGERRRSGGHPGIDIDGETGDTVRAAGDGIVQHAGPSPQGYSGYGSMVLIAHGGAVETLYAHLSRVDVRAGDVVRRGDRIGAIGTTGAVTGSHLHFEVRVGGRQVDPRPWLPPR